MRMETQGTRVYGISGKQAILFVRWEVLEPKRRARSGSSLSTVFWAVDFILVRVWITAGSELENQVAGSRDTTVSGCSTPYGM